MEQEEALRQLDESIFFLLLLIAGLFFSLIALFLERQALVEGTAGPAEEAARVRRRAAALELVTAGYFLTVTVQSADAFIRNIKKYLEAPELTREMCYELLDRVIVGGHPKITGKEREIDIVYKVDIASVLRHKLNK